jgi:hypothetical protein
MAKYDRQTGTISNIKFKLYDLDNDPSEQRNLMNRHPEIFERMKTELQRLLDDGRS